MIELIDFENVRTVGSGDAQRLFHGRGHCYPGLSHVCIDWMPPVILITLYQEVEEAWLSKLTNDLVANMPECQSVMVQYRNRPMSPFELLFGEEFREFVVEESGLKFNIQLGNTQNTGLFLDMKNGRDWVRQHAKDKNVLNLFAYTCAFSVSAIAGGARLVVNIDISKGALKKGRLNHRVNQQTTERVRFEGVNIFNSYSRLRKYAPYDVLICDPPSLQKGSVNIERDYKKIIRRVPQLMRSGGKLMLCLNSPYLDESFIQNMINEECPNCIYQEALQTPEVYCEAEAGKGLKILIYEYGDSENQQST